jgi:peptidoglycan/LPS O-acetylase OafA/YrhL
MIVPESRKTPFYPALDGIRTLAVAMVFVVHENHFILPIGWVGVQVFFVLSGFLITGILFDTRHDAGRYQNFYMRRALRIFPLYYGFLFVCFAVLVATHARIPRLFALWPFYLQNFFWLLGHNHVSDALITGNGHNFGAIGHLWSLAVEEQFYLVWPLIVFWVKDRKRLMQICCALIVFRLGLAAYWQMALSPAVLAGGLTYRMLPTQCDALLMGGWLALWLRGTPRPKAGLRAGSLAIGAIGFYAALIFLLHRYPALVKGQDVFEYTSGFQAVIGLPLVNLVSLAVLFAALQPAGWVHGLFDFAPLRSLGQVSYGLYVFHLPMILIARSKSAASFLPVLHGRAWLQAALAITLTVSLSYLSFYFFEKRFLVLKNRFTSKEASKNLQAGNTHIRVS